MITTAEENALRISIEKLQKENIEMRAISTKNGFYNQYFIALKTAANNRQAFDLINERYFNYFGQYRYADYNSFKRMTHYYHNNKK